MKSFERCVSIATLVLVSLSSASFAQASGNPGDRCRAASEVLAHENIVPADRWAFAAIVACPDAGSVLAGVWSHLPTDAGILRDLTHRSGDIADRRILDAAMSAMHSTTVDAHRRAALNTVLKQYGPSLVMTTGNWENPESTGLGRNSDYYQVPGEQPITPGDRQRVISVFREMGRTETDIKWRRVAAMIAAELALIH